MCLTKKVISTIVLFSYVSSLSAQSFDDITEASQLSQTENSESTRTPESDRSSSPQNTTSENRNNYNDILSSSIAGREDAAANHGTVGWGVFGIASGFLFGIIGVGASTLISVIPSPKPEKMPDTSRVKDGKSYEKAYSNKSRKKNVTTTVLLSSVGWLISIPVVAAMKK